MKKLRKEMIFMKKIPTLFKRVIGLEWNGKSAKR